MCMHPMKSGMAHSVLKCHKSTYDMHFSKKSMHCDCAYDSIADSGITHATVDVLCTHVQDGQSCLYTASQYGHLEVVKYLHKQGCRELLLAKKVSWIPEKQPAHEIVNVSVTQRNNLLHYTVKTKCAISI